MAADASLKRRNGMVLATVFAVVAGMVALSFAAVPLYDLFCRVTGFGGTTQVAIEMPETVLDRRINVRFHTDTGRGLPWGFVAEARELTVQIGQPALTSFTAINESDSAVVGTAIYNVTPAKIGRYFYKVNCFCFEEQLLGAGQKQHFPVYFFIDPAVADDPDLDDVTTVTLSYTFFEAKSQSLAAAAEAYKADAAALAREAGLDYTAKETADAPRRSAYQPAAAADANDI